MSKQEYLRHLKELLAGLPQEERSAAMEYYTDYLEDAGPEGEAEAMEHLGTPETVAAAIKDGLKNDTASGYAPGRDRYPGEDGANEVGADRNLAVQKEAKSSGKSKPFSRAIWILLVLCGIVCLGIPVLSVTGSVLLAVIAALAAVSLGGFAVFLGLLIAGIVLLVLGAGQLLVLPGLGVMLLGGGLICLSFALLALVAGVWILGWFVPWICRGVAWVIRRMFGTGGKKK